MSQKITFTGSPAKVKLRGSVPYQSMHHRKVSVTIHEQHYTTTQYYNKEKHFTTLHCKTALHFRAGSSVKASLARVTAGETNRQQHPV